MMDIPFGNLTDRVSVAFSLKFAEAITVSRIGDSEA